MNITKSYRLPRRDEIIIHRLRIGHTFLTHGYLLKRDTPPQCSACQTQLTVEHVLLHCPTWNAIRANHFTTTSLLNLFSNVTSRCIVDFIKEIGFYRRIWSPRYFYFYRFYHFFVFNVCSLSWLILSSPILDTNSLFVLMCRWTPHKQTNRSSIIPNVTVLQNVTAVCCLCHIMSRHLRKHAIWNRCSFRL